MYTERQLLRFAHIVENADWIAEHIGELSYEEFAASRITVDAVERCLSRITEAAIRAGDEAMHGLAPDVPLHVLRGFGNALRHDYDQIDLPTIWRTVKNDLPVLRERCAAALGENGGG